MKLSWFILILKRLLRTSTNNIFWLVVTDMKENYFMIKGKRSSQLHMKNENKK